MVRLVVVGSCNMDLSMTVPRLPGPGEFVQGGDLVRGPGGKGACQAVGAARLGADVTLVGCLGRDPFGDDLIATYEREGIDISYMARADATNGAVLIMVDERTGQNSMAVSPGANVYLTGDHVRAAESAFAEVDMLLVQQETSGDAARTAIEIARTHDVPVLLNPAPIQPYTAEQVPRASYVTPNQQEAHELTGRPANTLSESIFVVRALLEMGAPVAIPTLGDMGCLIAEGERVRRVHAYDVDVVDATAAGDAFNAALGVALAEGQPLVDAVVFANAVGAITVTRYGAVPALPTREEVAAFMSAHPAPKVEDLA
jgi:ribokinase